MLRIDWPKVKALSIDGGMLPLDSALFCLPVAGRDLLMSIMERFEWEATFRVPGYDYSDWDYLQSVVANTANGLMGTVLMNELIEQLTRIADILEENLCCTQDELLQIKSAIEDVSVVVNCGGGGGGDGNTMKDWRFPTNWEEDWPTEATPESNDPTEETFGTLCDNAHSAWHEINIWFQQFVQNINDENPYKEMTDSLIWAQMTASTLLTPYQAWVWSAMSATVALAYDGLLSDVANHWESLKEDFICQVVNNENAVDLRAWVFQAIRENPPTWSSGYYMEVLLTGTHFTCLYDGSYNPLPEFIGSDCSFCTPADYKIIQQALPSGIISEIFVASDEDTTYTLVADESHYSAPGNESFLYILSFVDPLLETAVNVDVELVSHSGWTAPTNTNHPLSVQNHNYGGGSTVVLGLGNVPTVPLSILASQGVVFHSKTQFTVTFRLTPHI